MENCTNFCIPTTSKYHVYLPFVLLPPPPPLPLPPLPPEAPLLLPPIGKTTNKKCSDQPEVGLRYYRRLLQMGANSPEVWQNLGLCCFYAAQYDMSLKCLERALAMASDDIAADIWYEGVQCRTCTMTGDRGRRRDGGRGGVRRAQRSPLMG